MNKTFHMNDITCFALHHERPLIMSGDLDGKVCAT